MEILPSRALITSEIPYLTIGYLLGENIRDLKFKSCDWLAKVRG